MVFRVIGLFLMTMGVAGALVVLLATLAEARTALLIAALYVLPHLVLGVFFFASSKKLARWVCYDFEKFND